MQGKQRYKGRVCLALPNQLCSVMTAVVCYKGQTLLQLNTRINQQRAGQWIMFSVNQVLFPHINTVSSSETSGPPLCVKSLAGLCHTTPPPSNGRILQPNPPHTHRHTIQFRALSYVQKKRLWKQAPVIMRQELDGGRKQPSPPGSTGSRRLRSASCRSCEISIYIVARNTKTWTCKGLAEWGVAWPLRRPTDWQLYFYRLLQTATNWTLTRSSELAAVFCPQAVQAWEQHGDVFASERRSKCFSVNLATQLEPWDSMCEMINSWLLFFFSPC